MYRLCSIWIIVLLSASVSGGVLEVGQNKAYDTLKRALSLAQSGDTLMVYPGTYKEGTI